MSETSVAGASQIAKKVSSSLRSFFFPAVFATARAAAQRTACFGEHFPGPFQKVGILQKLDSPKKHLKAANSNGPPRRKQAAGRVCLERRAMRVVRAATDYIGE